MGDTLEIFGKEFTNVAGFKAKDNNGNTLTYTRGGSGGGTITIAEIPNATGTTLQITTNGSGGGSSGGQTASGTVTGDGTNILQISCSFAPDLIYVYGDLSEDVTYRGIASVTIVKDEVIYASADTTTSSTDEYASIIKGITGYNESSTTAMHATYSNNMLTIDSASSSTSGKWRSGQVYNYELVSWSSSGGGGGTSATQHNIYFEFSDNTNTTIPVYYDDALLSTMITAYTPSTYGSKTVTLAQLDSVTWYEPANIPLNTELIDFTKVSNDTGINKSTGEEEYSQWYCVSDYTFVDPSMTFSFACQYWGTIGFYDINKNYLGSANPYGQSWATQRSNNTNFCDGTLSGNVFPNNTAYVRLPSINYADNTVLSLIRTA